MLVCPAMPPDLQLPPNRVAAAWVPEALPCDLPPRMSGTRGCARLLPGLSAS